MFVASNFVLALARLVELAINAYIWIIIARAIISWVNPDPGNPVVRFLHRITEPVLRPLRYRLPTLSMGLDLSPMVVILVLYFLDWFFVSTLRDLAISLR
jgi:YggT family protein